MSNYKDIQKKKDAELVTMVEEQREVLRSARFNAAGTGTRNVKAVREARQQIAHGLTELNARARGIAKKSE